MTIADTTAPVVTAPANVTVASTGTLTAVTLGTPSATDLVDLTLTPTNDAPAGGFPVGITTVTYSAQDTAGNIGTATQTVTITDTTAPVVTPPAAVTAEATGPQTTVALGTATANDAVDGAITPTNNAPASFPVGVTTVTYSATDADGNTGTATQTVTITDTTAPVVTAPANVTVASTGTLTAVTLGTATATDLVDGAITPTNDAPVGGFMVGSTAVTWSAVDTAGNIGTATQFVTVTDTSTPVVTASNDITVEATGPLTTVSLTTATATDAEDGTLIPTNNAPAGGFQVGTTFVTWSATDSNGNTGTAVQWVTVTDTTAPVVAAPVAITVEATSALTTVALVAATVTDLVDVTLTPTNDVPVGGFPVGMTTVTYSAQDTAGNIGTATQTVTVTDITSPTVTPPIDVTVPATGAITTVSLVAATATDLVDGAITPTNDAPAGGFLAGTTVVTWSGTDSNGNTGTATQNVTVTALPPASDFTTTFEYDALNRVVAVTDPLGNIRRTAYDENGKVASQSVDYFQDDNGTPGNPLDDNFVTRVNKTFVYDAGDRLVKETDVDGNFTTFGYDSRGNLITVTDAHGHVTRFEYDSMNRRTAVIDANGGVLRTEYDLKGQALRTIDGNGNVVSFEYDPLGRQTKITTQLGRQSQFVYDGNGNATQVTDPLNRITTNVYDEFNRLIKTTDAKLNDTFFTYDLTGNRTSVTDAEGNTTLFNYDGLGRLIETKDPLIEIPDKSTVYTHDSFGNVLTMTDRKGEVTQFTYDDLNRLVGTEYFADGTGENRKYNIFGNLTEVRNGDVTYNLDYDNQNRLTAKTDIRSGHVPRSLAWTYDPVSNILTKTGYEGFVTNYQYNSSNQLSAMSNLNHLQVSYFYDAAGRLMNRLLSNGVKSFYRYDDDNRLTELRNEGSDGSTVSRTVYGYDNVGNITSVDEGPVGSTQTTLYTYDELNWLKTVDAPGTAEDLSYLYDNVGNRLSQTDATETLLYSYNANNQLTQVERDELINVLLLKYVYDANGNRIEKRNGSDVLLYSYLYDQKNRVASLSKGARTYNYAYDASNFRVESEDAGAMRNYYLEGEHLELMADETDRVIDRYFRGAVIDEIVHGYHVDVFAQNEEVGLTFHHDHINSVTATLGHLGVLQTTSDYGPFGELLTETGDNHGNRLRYTGRELDVETGLYYYRARYYDPEIGRFLTEDPLGFLAGPNFYAYVNNNPINANDPSGLFTMGAEVEVQIPSVVKEIFKNITGDEFPVDGFHLGVAQSFPFLDDGSEFDFGIFGGANIGLNTGFKVGADVFFQKGSVRDLDRDNSGDGFVLSATPGLISGGFRFNIDSVELQGIQFGPAVGINATAQGTATEVLSIRDVLGDPFGASGGFVIYPNKPNTNIMQQVYKK